MHRLKYKNKAVQMDSLINDYLFEIILLILLLYDGY